MKFCFRQWVCSGWLHTPGTTEHSRQCADKKATALSGGKGAAQMSAHDHFADPNLTKKTQ